jgi:hypothetical protein
LLLMMNGVASVVLYHHTPLTFGVGVLSVQVAFAARLSQIGLARIQPAAAVGASAALRLKTVPVAFRPSAVSVNV